MPWTYTLHVGEPSRSIPFRCRDGTVSHPQEEVATPWAEGKLATEFAMYAIRLVTMTAQRHSGWTRLFLTTILPRTDRSVKAVLLNNPHRPCTNSSSSNPRYGHILPNRYFPSNRYCLWEISMAHYLLRFSLTKSWDGHVLAS